jgi:hypothetical protein
MDIETSYRESVIRDEMMKMIRESAALKARDSFILTGEHINAALVAFIGQYDLYVALWDEKGSTRALAIRRSLNERGDLRGNAAFVQDRATAIALHAACRSDDNCAPEPAGLGCGPSGRRTQ